jgi:O-antigen/teichoic acid export membrane protein
MGVRGALELYMSVTVSMLFAMGTSKYAAIGNGLKLAFMAIGLTVAFGRYGLHAALWILMLAPLANYAPLLLGLRRHCQSVVREEMFSFLGFAATTAAAALLFVMVAGLRSL